MRIGKVNDLARRMIVHHRLLVRAIGYPQNSHLIALKLNLIMLWVYFGGVLRCGGVWSQDYPCVSQIFLVARLRRR